MATYEVIQADFETGAHNLGQMPQTGLPEVAFVGRSNVGKSSLINRVTARKSLARTSGTPGRTQEINFFRIQLRTESVRAECYCVDLPGFGYGKFSKGKRQAMSRLTVEYVAKRADLTLLCLLNDSKRLPEKDELALRDLAYERGIPVLVVVTKVDRLNQKERQQQLIAIAKAFSLEVADLAVTGEKTPATQLWERICPFVDGTI
jgi:GTP-binding protein